MRKNLTVLFLAAEADPLAKVGGLADVAGSLPAALRSLPQGPDVRLVLPFYPPLKDRGLKTRPVASFLVPHTAGPLRAEVVQLEVGGVPTYLIDGPPVAGSTRVYSGDNHQDGTKFTFFSLAALQLAQSLDWRPDILHAHDWHTSPALYRLTLSRGQEAIFQNTRSLLTVHNLPYLGYGAEAALQAFGLPRAHLSALPDWAEQLPLPLGLMSADLINTVSPGYAREMLTTEYGAGLEEFLQSRPGALRGILNGLDTGAWDPRTDPHLPANYTAETLPARKANKARLLEELGLAPNPDLPLFAMINRMDYQKGVDLVPDAFREIRDEGWQAVILGTGNAELEEASTRLDREMVQVRSIIKFEADLAHRIYGASDLILIPSRYEPCGLTQMIAMRYGCVPLARETGGLGDTIQDYQRDPRSSTGFLFKKATAAELAGSIRAALQVYADQRRWRGLQRRGMKRDFSWNKSAEQYYHLYQELAAGIPGQTPSAQQR